MKKVIILEPNPYHNEVLPGIVKYFEDLDYTADVYVREECYYDNAFCRYAIKGIRKSYRLEDVAKILLDEKIKEYDFIFFSSMEHCENGSEKRFLTELGFIPNTKYGVLGMYHSNTLIDKFNDYELLRENRLFCISEFQTKNYHGLRTLPPIYFASEVKEHKIDKSKKRTLLLIGNASDFPAVTDAWWRLTREKRHKLEIKHIGSLPGRDISFKGFLYQCYCLIIGIFDYSYRSQKFITKLGRLSFERMYEEVENADFLVCMIDPSKENTRHYMNQNTSGIRQQAFGFHKPVIINESVAEIYDISSEASVLYHDNGFCKAIERCIDMSYDEYFEMIQQLEADAAKLYRIGLENLSKCIDEHRIKR